MNTIFLTIALIAKLKQNGGKINDCHGIITDRSMHGMAVDGSYIHGPFFHTTVHCPKTGIRYGMIH